MHHPMNHRVPMALGLAMIVFAISFSGSAQAAGALTGQADRAVEESRFEVASITPHRDNGSVEAGFDETPGIVRIRNLSLHALIGIAYSVMDSQLVGPSWLDRVAFDVVAKPPSGYQSSHLPALLRNLLADRFKLVVHRERKDVAGFALRLEPGGHRLAATKASERF